LHVDGLHGLMMVIPTASCMLLCVGLSEAIEPDSRKHFLPASHVSRSLGFTAEAEYGVAQTPVISFYRTSAGESKCRHTR
jgi:hypothetical protein